MGKSEVSDVKLYVVELNVEFRNVLLCSDKYGVFGCIQMYQMYLNFCVSISNVFECT